MQTNNPETYFAPAFRADAGEVQSEAERAGRSPLLDTLLRTFGAIIAVLNQHRQILAVNDSLLQTLGVEEPESLLGLRPGEAFHCVHADDHPGGCGTSRFCSTCGAAIAIVLAQETNAPQERECMLTINNGSESSMELSVRAVPLEVDGDRLVLLLLNDISEDKRRRNLERIFFHDLKNTLTGLMGTAETLKFIEPTEFPEAIERIETLCERLNDEIRSQQILSQGAEGKTSITPSRFTVGCLLQKVEDILRTQTLSSQRQIEIRLPEETVVLETDPVLLRRVLVNMCKNALEATDPGGTVRLDCNLDDDSITFRVWNARAMEETVAMRVFQRFFTTKGESGRGLGTYSMKLLGERYLGGKVWFETDSGTGTVFSFRMPRSPAEKNAL